MYRDGVRVRDLNGNQFDVPLGVFTAALPLMSYDPATNTFKGVAAPSGGGDFNGPASSVDNHLVLFNGITGKLGKDTSPIVAAPSGNLSGIAGILASGSIQGGSFITGGTITSGLINGVDITNLDGRLNPGGADTMFAGTWAAGDVAEWNGTGWDPKFIGHGFNTAAQTSAVTALADITGHTFALPRAGTYFFRLRGQYRSNATTTGLRISASFSGTSSAYNGALSVVTSATGAVEEYFAQTTLNTAMGSGNGPGAADQAFEFWGRLVSTSSGTFAFRIASEVAVASGISLAVGALSEITQL